MSSTTDDLGKLILRLVLGILVLLHGLSKLDSGIGWIGGMLQGHGLPGFVSYGVYIGEELRVLVFNGGHDGDARVDVPEVVIVLVGLVD